MMRARTARLLAVLSLSIATLATSPGCENTGDPDVTVEKLPDVKPNLPAVPTLPPPPHPVQYADQSYSVFGLRKRLHNTIDSEISLTGFVVKVYEPPECPKKKACAPAKAPHLYLADTEAEAGTEKRILLVGYAENQKALNEAIEDAKRGRYKPPPPETGLLPIPTDLFTGAKVKVKAQFSRASGGGFAQSDGLLDYRGHELLQAAVEAAE